MSLGKKEVQVIANLSALKVAESEVENVADKLTNVLDLFAQMQSVDTSGIEPMSHPLEQTQRLREDVVTETSHREKYQQIAPATEEYLYLVPQVID